MNFAHAPFISARWLLMMCCFLAALWLGALNGLGRLDQTLIDLSAARHGRPIDPDIIIIAIDDPSISALGRWPWPRTVHAALLDQIRAARAVGFDLILSEPDAHVNDQILAQALQRHGKVVLPVFLSNHGGVATLTLPLPSLAANAADLAHINTEIDLDGLVRSVYLQEGDAGSLWNHLAVALLKIGKENVKVRLSKAKTPPAQPSSSQPVTRQWLRVHHLHLPLAGPPQSYPFLSYRDVLAGKYNPEFFRNKYVLVGVTATGLGDVYTTPMSGEKTLMSGVELLANTLDSVRNQYALRLASTWENALFTLVTVSLSFLALQHLRLSWALGAQAGLFCGVVLFCDWMQGYAKIQFAPLAALTLLVLIYPLWSWLRMRAALLYFATQVEKIRQEDPILASLPQEGYGSDLLDRKMAALNQAVEQLSNLRRFVRNSLDQLSDCVLVCDIHGNVVLENQAAQIYFARSIQGQPFTQSLSEAIKTAPILSSSLFSQFGSSEQVQDHLGRVFLLKSAPRHDAYGKTLGWIISMIDLSLIQMAQRQREEALDFLSHDMRSPQSAILALLTLHQNENPHIDRTLKHLFSRIANHAQRTLQLAEHFVQLARANTAQLIIEPTDLNDLLFETCDQFWEKAQLLNVQINVQSTLDIPLVTMYPADRQMLGRALGNLIDNALKYGIEGNVIECSITRLETQEIALSIQDYGAGIDPQQQIRLLDKFTQLGSSRHGVGLGLAFVKVVAERHAGRVQIHSAVGEGSRFSIVLPLLNVSNCQQLLTR